MKKSIGKIINVKFGFGGYQDVQFGISITVDTTIGGATTGIWAWTNKPDENCKWTEDDQSNIYADIIRYVIKLMTDAKVDRIEDLKGIPIEATWENSMLTEIRVLTEVIL